LERKLINGVRNKQGWNFGNVSLEVIREFLGHSDIKSTLVYARLRGEKLQEAVSGFDTTLTQIAGQ